MEGPSTDSRGQWRFTWEILAHIPTLRLYLFNPQIGNISAVCRDPNASLKLGEFLLVISWQSDGESGSTRTPVLTIPVPRVLIDPGCDVDVKVMGDHIEVKLVLLLPVEHPLLTDMLGAPGPDVEQRLPLSLDSDIEKFSSEGVNFFCKRCSTKLTRQPLRKFVEIPSTNWQDVADNWFGGCCSFGGVSEKLVSKYMDTFDCKVGTCLLGRASVTVCKQDLEGAVLEKTFSDLEMTSPKFIDSSSSDLVPSPSCSDIEVLEIDSPSNVYSSQSTLVNTQPDVNMDFLKINLNYHSEYHEKMDPESIGGRTSKCVSHCCITEASHAADDEIVKFKASEAAYTAQQASKVYGSGFMITPFNLSEGTDFFELSCGHCSSPLGSYQCAQGTVFPFDCGIQLFKCYISTSLSVDAVDDRFKKYTLQSVFTNLLVEGAQDELSFRLMVCDLRTRSPALQIVLLNSRVWCSSGFCFENTMSRGHPSIHLGPVVKVLFSDYNAPTEAYLMDGKGGPARPGGIEEVYMMSSQIEELRSSLESSLSNLPLSCSSLQGMSLSFLER